MDFPFFLRDKEKKKENSKKKYPTFLFIKKKNKRIKIYLNDKVIKYQLTG